MALLWGANVVAAAQPEGLARRVYLLDVHPLCYRGDRPDPLGFVHWIDSLLKIVHNDALVAVFDGANGNDFRRRLLPSYKAQRRKYQPRYAKYKWTKGYNAVDLDAVFPCIHEFLSLCKIPVLKVDDAEADDVVATLTSQALHKRLQAVIASPDKDFKQLLSEDVQLFVPLADLRRWSFYTLKDYIYQHKCEPSIELSLRCLLGDAVDGVPGLPNVSSGWGRNTALKLMKKYGSLTNLLEASAVRTVGKPYIQNALKEHASFLRNNYEVLSLRRDVDVVLEDSWCLPRERANDGPALKKLQAKLEKLLP